ncbi:unnamed protein product [[Candida] boidinii]|nr:unnamed protein product [[Candida] boidinii]
MRDFQEAPTFGKMEHYIGSQMYNGKTIQENPFEINNISSSNISIQEDIQAQVEYYKFIKDENKKINYITRNYISWKDWNHEYHGFSRRSNSPRDEIQHDIDLFDDKYRKYIANENERISNLNKVEQVEPQVEPQVEIQVEKEIEQEIEQIEPQNEQIEPQNEIQVEKVEPQIEIEIEQVEQEIEPQAEQEIEQVEYEIEKFIN